MILFAMSITDIAKEDIMLTHYFFRSCHAGFDPAHSCRTSLRGLDRRIDRAWLQSSHERAAAHLSYWQQRRARSLTDLDATNLGEVKQHLRTCQCKGFQRVNDYDLRGAQMLLRHLQQTAVISVTDRTRKVKKLKRQRTRPLIHGPVSGSADRPAHSWGDQWRRGQQSG